MRTIIAGLSAMALSAVVAFVVLSADASGDTPRQSPPGLVMGLDMKISGNNSRSLGAIDKCVSVNPGDPFSVDVYVREVKDLLAWEVYFSYDRSLLEVTARDAKMLITNTGGSSVIDISDPVPNTRGLYRAAAADIAIPAALDSGSGVLARLTLMAKEKGISQTSLPYLTASIGPRLVGSRGGTIGDVDGDGLFDGPVSLGVVAIGEPCDDVPPEFFTPTPRPSPLPGETPGSGGTTGANATATAAATAAGTAGPGDGEGGNTDNGNGNTDNGGEQSGDATATAIAGEGQGPTSTSGGASGGGLPMWLVGALSAAMLGFLGFGLLVVRTIMRPTP